MTIARKTILFLAAATVLPFSACKKTSTFKYKATCIDCVVSYYDENGNFVQKEPHQGTFEKEITIARFAEVMVAVQSQVYLDSAATNPVFAGDAITVELWKDGDKVCGDDATGKKLQAITCGYSWPK